ncbi:Predicted O-linked N-acetylglucosamine transferase, SPINDLY family [Allopseudospirillum japonicum]|uniref:protein O-GlcNAc transferase n=1 Tax=Allopseudospirillum japonicum TaxID=64971 RepID=A0A1H6STM4_9GAMM|nr:tetratricopeptide repeat protein [Allopseudospirillum japonicum]SEI68117.1 Predicted O-linked N-acetylglucosamine transferase, SPINDLY family [Allopseudospirillum japonicum]
MAKKKAPKKTRHPLPNQQGLRLLPQICKEAEQALAAKDFIICTQKVQQAKRIAPKHKQVLLLEGRLYTETQDYAAGIKAYQTLLTLDDKNPRVYNNLAHLLNRNQAPEAAIECYYQALALDKTYRLAYKNALHVLRKLKRTEEIGRLLGQGLAALPDDIDLLKEYAKYLRDTQGVGASLDVFRRLLELRPDDAQIWNSLGVALDRNQQTEEAARAFQKAAELQPEYGLAHRNAGNTLAALSKREQAAAHYRLAIQYEPEYRRNYSNLLYQLQHLCAWDEIAELSVRVDQITQQALQEEDWSSIESPFSNITHCDDLALNQQVAQVKARLTKKAVAQYAPFDFSHRSFNTNQRLKIGYLSCDYHAHATAHLIASLFKNHDHQAFEIIGYSYGRADHSEYRQRIVAGCDDFVDLRPLNDRQAAERIYQDEVDILVDLKGFTKGSRLEICAQRPAPVQVTWLGFPGTSGADFFDYVITDRIVTPPEYQAYFNETFAYMPHTYQVNDQEQAITEPRPTRTDLGLPEDGFIFASFNQNYKIQPHILHIWLEILKVCPHSYLWLLRSNAVAEANILTYAERQGVAERLIFADRAAKPDHLARLGCADLVLDTELVNGHTTTSDALWAGVPVLAIEGQHFASRVSASLLQAMHLPELIVPDRQTYQTRAIALAQDPQGELAQLRQRLAEQRLSAPLFNTLLFAQDLERLYRQMWHTWCEKS